MTNQHAQPTLLSVRNLGVSFKTDEGMVRAVNGIDFQVARGRTLGIVGESGSGKSVSTRALVQLLPNSARIDAATEIDLLCKDGRVVDLARLKPNSREIRQIRGGEIGMIFQEPMSAFSPVYTVGNQIIEAIRQHRNVSAAEARDLALHLLERVGIANPSHRLDQYPFELSGGMRQRAMIAVALASGPSLLIADEPTTALDVTIQAQILELLADLRDELQMAIIFITHDLGVIAKIADEVAVMYLGQILERGPVRQILTDAQHPYTRSLLRAIPRLDRLGQRLNAIGGRLPSPLERPAGCPFHPRCAEAMAGRCNVSFPETVTVADGHEVNCFLYVE